MGAKILPAPQSEAAFCEGKTRQSREETPKMKINAVAKFEKFCEENIYVEDRHRKTTKRQTKLDKILSEHTNTYAEEFASCAMALGDFDVILPSNIKELLEAFWPIEQPESFSEADMRYGLFTPYAAVEFGSYLIAAGKVLHDASHRFNEHMKGRVEFALAYRASKESAPEHSPSATQAQ